MAGRFFAVCCAADLTSEIMDSFLQENEDFFHSELPVGVVFVDRLDRVYSEPTSIGNNHAASSAESPFKDIGPEKSFRLVRRLRARGSAVDSRQFAIMDARSLEDRTVLVVQEPLDLGDEMATIRVAFRDTVSRLIAYMVGDSHVAEDQAVAQAAEDGVYRSNTVLGPRARP